MPFLLHMDVGYSCCLKYSVKLLHVGITAPMAGESRIGVLQPPRWGCWCEQDSVCPEVLQDSQNVQHILLTRVD